MEPAAVPSHVWLPWLLETEGGDQLTRKGLCWVHFPRGTELTSVREHGEAERSIARWRLESNRSSFHLLSASFESGKTQVVLVALSHLILNPGRQGQNC